MYARHKNNKWFFGPDGFGPHTKGLKGALVKIFGKMRFAKEVDNLFKS